MSVVTTLNEKNFTQEVLLSPVPVIVDFWAPWCGPCKAIAPVFEEAASEYANKVKFAKLNVDDSPDVARKYGIRSIPTILILRQGEVVDTKIGLGHDTKSELSEFVD